MKKYRITVDGKAYEVDVEELNVAAADRPYQSSFNSDHAEQTVRGPIPGSSPATGAGSGTITAPMPGTVLSVEVTAGQSVKAGDVLLILESMKMENEILAPSAGRIVSVSTVKGAAVSAGDILITMAV